MQRKKKKKKDVALAALPNVRQAEKILIRQGNLLRAVMSRAAVQLRRDEIAQVYRTP